VVFSGLFYCLLSRVMGAPGVMIGSSGGIYGLLVAYGILFKERVMLFMMLFPMKAKHFVWILAGVEFLSSISYGRSGIMSFAHLAGMGAGYLFLYGRATWNVFIKQRKEGWASTQRIKRVKGASHLKLVKNERPGSSGSKDDRTWH
jgi:membrane associated rhomboid family serine protease